MEWWEEWQCMETHEADTEYWQRGRKAQENYTFIHVNCPEGIQFTNQDDKQIKGHIVYKCIGTDAVFCGGCNEPAPSNAWGIARITGANVVLVDEEGKKVGVSVQ